MSDAAVLPLLPEGTKIRDAVKLLVGAEDSPFAVDEMSISGISQTVFTAAPSAVRDVFAYCSEHGEMDFICFGDERLTFNETLKRAHQLSHVFVDRFNIKKGDRIAIAMRNYPEWIIAYMAASGCGAVLVTMNSWWTPDELAWAFDDCGCKLAVVDGQLKDRVKGFYSDRDVDLIVARGDAGGERCYAWDEMVAEGAGIIGWPDIEVLPEDDHAITYTSGSTGFPKGAVSTQRGLITVLMAWAATNEAQKMIGRIPMERETQAVALVTIPFFHVTGCNNSFLLSVIGGRRIILMYKWDIQEAFRLIEREKVTSFVGVPTMSYELTTNPDRVNYDLTSLEDLGAGGAARPADHLRILREAFPSVIPGIGYGLTETNALGTLNHADEYYARPGSAGRATWPAAKIKIMDPETGAEMPVGERGEIWIKSAANIRGYWNNVAATEAAFRDSWFMTGDIGYLDDEDFLFIVDRLKDIIIRGGENISTLEVEDILLSHPDVQEAVVFGLPDERLGEIVGCVALSDGTGEDEIKAFLKGKVAGFKIPTKIWTVSDKLPRIASGKLDRKGLKEKYRAVWQG